MDLWDKLMEPFEPDIEEDGNVERGILSEEKEHAEESISVEEEEGIEVKVGKAKKGPSKEEVARHMVNHIPFRSWCSHCVKGKAHGNQHRRRKVVKDEIREPIVSVDYMFMHDNQGEGEERGMPIMVVKDRKTRVIRARVVPQKGNHGYGIKVLSGVIESLGHSRVILKSDQEPALMSLKDAVKSEVRADVVLEESPEYESKSNGEVERAIQMVQGQFRTMKDRLESRYNQRIGGEHPCIPW